MTSPRIRKVVHRDSTILDTPLEQDEVVIHRVPVDRWVDAPVPDRRDGDTLILSVTEEVLVVEKRLKVTEEIHITRRKSTRHQRDEAVLRREEAVLEPAPPETALTENAEHPGEQNHEDLGEHQ